MTHDGFDRRDFLINGSRVGIAVCGLCVCPVSPALAASNGEGTQQPLDPKKLNFCGYTCPADCKFKVGTLTDDVELKKQAFKAWKIEERHGIAFDPATAICYGCKAPGKAEGVAVANCDVRKCVQDKGLDCCIECSELAGCERDLWRRFPEFKKQVDDMRSRYLAQT